MMRMKISSLLYLGAIIVLTSCAIGTRQRAINEIPEYGHQPKSPYLLQADQEFLSTVKGQESEAYNEINNCGWKLLQQGDIKTAVKRFNQAWLIDSTRFEAHWGFAVAEGRLENFQSSKHYYEKALSLGGDPKVLNPEYAIVLREIAKAEKNSEKITEADNLFKSEIEAGNEKAACIYAYQLFRENKKDEVCQVMKSCSTDSDNLKKRADCN